MSVKFNEKPQLTNQLNKQFTHVHYVALLVTCAPLHKCTWKYVIYKTNEIPQSQQIGYILISFCLPKQSWSK